MTRDQMERLTPMQRLANMRRFDALWRLSEKVRQNPAFLSLPNLRRAEPQSRS